MQENANKMGIESNNRWKDADEFKGFQIYKRTVSSFGRWKSGVGAVGK